MRKMGIDISAHQKAVDWKKVKSAGVEFAILRAGYGNTPQQQDKMFKSHMIGAHSVGLPIGVYWFSYARSVEEAREEARACLSVLEPYKSCIRLPVFFDFEYDSETYAKKHGTKVNARYVTDVTRVFCEIISAAGYMAGYYTNQDYYKNKLYPDELLDYELWLADYTEGPSYPCSIQQTTSRGKVDGIRGDADLNICFAPYEMFRGPVLFGNCTGDGVRIRTDSHTAARVKGVANKDDLLVLIDDDGWGWSKVKTKDTTGWMFNAYINGPNRSKPRTVTCHGTRVNLRKKPSTRAKIVKQLNEGDKVTLVSINPDGWLHVSGGYLFYDSSYLTID